MTSYVVIDAGVAFKLLVLNPAREGIKLLTRQWMEQGLTLCAPALWLYELTSIFTRMVHFGELDEEDAHAGLILAAGLGIQLMQPGEEQASRAFAWTRCLNRAAANDSFYLALAEELDCDLWTVDQRLASAVNQPWVRLVAVAQTVVSQADFCGCSEAVLSFPAHFTSVGAMNPCPHGWHGDLEPECTCTTPARATVDMGSRPGSPVSADLEIDIRVRARMAITAFTAQRGADLCGLCRHVDHAAAAQRHGGGQAADGRLDQEANCRLAAAPGVHGLPGKHAAAG